MTLPLWPSSPYLRQRRPILLYVYAGPSSTPSESRHTKVTQLPPRFWHSFRERRPVEVQPPAMLGPGFASFHGRSVVFSLSRILLELALDVNATTTTNWAGANQVSHTWLEALRERMELCLTFILDQLPVDVNTEWVAGTGCRIAPWIYLLLLYIWCRLCVWLSRRLLYLLAMISKNPPRVHG